MTGRTGRTRRPVQGALFGGQQPIPTPRSAKTQPVTNDMDLIETVIRLAREPGYVLIGATDRVYRRRTGSHDEVQPVPGYEADAVHQLLAEKLLTTGGTHQVRYSRHEGRATSVLVTRATARRAARWSSYHRPESWGNPVRQ
ncbi:MAG: hypothetical protein M3Z25_17560 [Actinomycetota bacterium]|nr:hypothetical protein [Actinomycetota bacterium]